MRSPRGLVDRERRGHCARRVCILGAQWHDRGGVSAALGRGLHLGSRHSGAEHKPDGTLRLSSASSSSNSTATEHRNAGSDRFLERRRQEASFRGAPRTLDNFDVTFNPKMNRSLVFADTQWIGPDRSKVIFYEPRPGHWLALYVVARRRRGRATLHRGTALQRRRRSATCADSREFICAPARAGPSPSRWAAARRRNLRSTSAWAASSRSETRLVLKASCMD